MNNMTVSYIGLGSNMGESEKYISKVVEVIADHGDFCIPMVSSLYKTSPVGDENQADFINAVVKVDTSLAPLDTLAFLLGLEKALGRKRDPANQNAARVIDCDLLLHGRESSDSSILTLPHPRMVDRLFVMQPLVEIAPKAYIPEHGYAKEVFELNQDQGSYDSQRVKLLTD